MEKIYNTKARFKRIPLMDMEDILKLEQTIK